MGVRGLDIFCGLNESDPRSNVHYLSSSEKKAWKIWTHDLCDTGIAEVMGSNPVQAWIFFFFQALFLLLLK